MIRLVEKNKKKKKRLITVYNDFPEDTVVKLKPNVSDQWFILDVSKLDGNRKLNI